MKKIISSVLVSALGASFAFAQAATINFNIKNSTFDSYRLFYQSGSFGQRANTIPLSFDKNGQASCTLNLDQARAIGFGGYDSKTKNTLNYSFFISPGDQISFNADLLAKDKGILVTGKGSNNNQPLFANMLYFNDDTFRGDTVPDRVIHAILKEEKVMKDKLGQYHMLNKPSKEFLIFQKLNLEYWAISTYHRYKENNKFGIRQAYKRNFNKWQSVQDSLFSAHPLDNPNALQAPAYTSLIADFLLREKERLWIEENENKDSFYKEWYAGDRGNGQLEFTADKYNLLREKIINKYFKGKTAEYLYAYLIINANRESNPNNIPAIYSRFKNKYANSAYEADLKPVVSKIEQRQGQGLNERMVFADSTATQLNTFDDLLKLAKNKTVLVDMWGTWCSPCREEIEKNSAEIKKHFKQKDLDYIYVANRDTRNAGSWKQLIAYFNLEGTHVLANEALTNSIMESVKGKSFPTYFLIKKDGSYELSKAGYPMDRAKLIKQLEEALTM